MESRNGLYRPEKEHFRLLEPYSVYSLQKGFFIDFQKEGCLKNSNKFKLRTHELVDFNNGIFNEFHSRNQRTSLE